MKFKFELGDYVTVVPTQRRGMIVGSAQSLEGDNRYTVRWMKADGAYMQIDCGEAYLVLTYPKAEVSLLL